MDKVSGFGLRHRLVQGQMALLTGKESLEIKPIGPWISLAAVQIAPSSATVRGRHRLLVIGPLTCRGLKPLRHNPDRSRLCRNRSF